MALKNEIEHVEHALDLREFHHQHVWIWRLQYAFSVLVVVIVALTLAGLFGRGWISHAEQARAGASVSYQRFVRYTRETVLEVRLEEPGEIRLPLTYLERFKLDHVVPQPRTQRVRGDRLVFVFDAPDGVTARFYLLPQNPGPSRTTLSAGPASFPVFQFTWP